MNPISLIDRPVTPTGSAESVADNSVDAAGSFLLAFQNGPENTQADQPDRANLPALEPVPEKGDLTARHEDEAAGDTATAPLATSPERVTKPADKPAPRSDGEFAPTRTPLRRRERQSGDFPIFAPGKISDGEREHGGRWPHALLETPQSRLGINNPAAQAIGETSDISSASGNSTIPGLPGEVTPTRLDFSMKTNGDSSRPSALRLQAEGSQQIAPENTFNTMNTTSKTEIRHAQAQDLATFPPPASESAKAPVTSSALPEHALSGAGNAPEGAATWLNVVLAAENAAQPGNSQTRYSGPDAAGGSASLPPPMPTDPSAKVGMIGPPEQIAGDMSFRAIAGLAPVAPTAESPGITAVDKNAAAHPAEAIIPALRMATDAPRIVAAGMSAPPRPTGEEFQAEPETAPNATQSAVTDITRPYRVETGVSVAVASAFAPLKNASDTVPQDMSDTGDTDIAFSPAHAFDGPSRFGQPAAPSARQMHPTPLPEGLGHRLALAATQINDRPVEVTLSPEELGRVRMTLSTHDGNLTMAIHAERPETLDLLRRHIDTLAQDFRDMGFADLNFSFGGGQDAPPNMLPDAFAAAQDDMAMAGKSEPLTIARPDSVPDYSTAKSGLDLRL